MTRKKRATLGEEIIEGLEEAIAYHRGERTGARTTRVPITATVAKVSPALGTRAPVSHA